MKRLCRKLEIHQVMEYKDGAVYRTKRVGEVWVTIDTQLPHQVEQLQFIETTEQYEYKEV